MWDDVVEEDKPAEAAPAAEPAAEEAPADAPQAEVAEPPPPENPVHGTDPKRLVCKHWVRYGLYILFILV